MQDMVPLIYTRQVRQKLERYPAVALIGPRQCGKTTLARELEGRYFDLESKAGLTKLDAEWVSLESSRELIVLDEVQHAPSVLARLRGTIDADRKRNGRFLLLGSVSPALMQSASESLAGRLGIVHMSPFILLELTEKRLDVLWLMGGFPVS